MTDDEIKRLMDLYHRSGVPPQRLYEPNLLETSHNQVRRHVQWMVQQVPTFLPEHREKAMRWIGFIQGCWFFLGEYTIAQMRDHNRSPE